LANNECKSRPLNRAPPVLTGCSNRRVTTGRYNKFPTTAHFAALSQPKVCLRTPNKTTNITNCNIGLPKATTSERMRAQWFPLRTTGLQRTNKQVPLASGLLPICPHRMRKRMPSAYLVVRGVCVGWPLGRAGIFDCFLASTGVNFCLSSGRGLPTFNLCNVALGDYVRPNAT
jgi:hypothetical protein